MKKWLIVLSLLSLCGCAPTQNPTIVPIDANATTEDTSQPSANNEADGYDEYNIFSYEAQADNQLLVTNLSDYVISNIYFTITYYDENNVVVDDSTASPDISMLSGQSAILDFYCEEDYKTALVTSYSYDCPEEFDTQGRRILVDVIAEDFEIIT